MFTSELMTFIGVYVCACVCVCVYICIVFVSSCIMFAINVSFSNYSTFTSSNLFLY